MKTTKRTYHTFTTMVINDDLGNVIVELCKETGQITFMCNSAINGELLEKIKQENESKINLFREKGVSREVK